MGQISNVAKTAVKTAYMNIHDITCMLHTHIMTPFCWVSNWIFYQIYSHVNIYSLSLQQCFSPSMQMPVKSNSFTPSPSPSPTRKSFMRWFLFHVLSPFSLFSFFQVKINDIQFLWNHFIKYQMLSHSLIWRILYT